MTSDRTRRLACEASVNWIAEPQFGGWYTELEYAAAADAMKEQSDWRRTSSGAHQRAFESAFASYCGTKHAVALNGAGTALDLVMRAMEFNVGDEVVSCALNFPGTHLSVIGAGARLVLCEPNSRTLNPDPDDLEAKLSPRTRAVLVTHMNGLPADIDELQAICDCHRTNYGTPKLIFDAARACGAQYRGRQLGRDGWATVFSFQRRKLMSTLGEGGMVVTNDDHLAERLVKFRGFGGGTDWGSNYHMTDVQAAVGGVQLSRLASMLEPRVALALSRTRRFANSALISPPNHPSDRSHLYYLYTIHLPESWTAVHRDRLSEQLRTIYRIGTVVANPPTYQSNTLISQHVHDQSLPIAERVGSRILALPLHPLMSTEEDVYIVASVCDAAASIDTSIQ